MWVNLYCFFFVQQDRELHQEGCRVIKSRAGRVWGLSWVGVKFYSRSREELGVGANHLDTGEIAG